MSANAEQSTPNAGPQGMAPQRADQVPSELLPSRNAGMPSSQNPSRPSASIIIPAHNEEAVIGRCLENLLQTAEPGEFEIVVVCNGCTDKTAEQARAFGTAVRVIETPIPSKTAALNLGDHTACYFPRIYLDADIRVSTDALRKTAAVLTYGKYLAAAPQVHWDLSRSNFLVRGYYAIWQLQPYFDAGRLGAGFYAVSRDGHARLGSFPHITADDEYVRRQFTEEERVAVAGCQFTVTPPRNLRSLIKIKTRSRRGNMELVQRFPELARPPRESRGKFLGRVLRRPALWGAFPLFVLVAAITSMRARKSLASRQPAPWERDLTSRENAG
jgi:glycosyltransferase involved in cell wall biosynthesis